MGPSYIWSIIWKAKEALKGGFRWVVGDGSSIKIYKDKWLRAKSDLCVFRGYEHESNDLRVKSLFLPDTRRWDEHYIRGIFNEEDAIAILSIPTSETQV